MAASKTVGDGARGVDVVTMTAKVGAGVMACASGAVGEAASGEDTVAAGTAFWDFAGGEGDDAHRGGGAAGASVVGCRDCHKIQKPRASGWAWQRLPEMRLPESWQSRPSLVVSQLLR